MFQSNRSLSPRTPRSRAPSVPTSRPDELAIISPRGLRASSLRTRSQITSLSPTPLSPRERKPSAQKSFGRLQLRTMCPPTLPRLTRSAAPSPQRTRQPEVSRQTLQPIGTTVIDLSLSISSAGIALTSRHISALSTAILDRYRVIAQKEANRICQEADIPEGPTYDAHYSSVFEALPKFLGVHALCLANIPLPRGLSGLLTRTTPLRKLSLRNSAMNSGPLVATIRAIQSHCPSLKWLDLCNAHSAPATPNMPPAPATGAGEALCSLLQSDVPLTTLLVDGIPMSHSDMLSFGAGLWSNRTLITLSCACLHSRTFCQAVAPSLSTHPTLTAVNVSRNSIPPEFDEAFLISLNRTDLVALGLARITSNASGVASLIQAAPLLKHIDLSYPEPIGGEHFSTDPGESVTRFKGEDVATVIRALPATTDSLDLSGHSIPVPAIVELTDWVFSTIGSGRARWVRSAFFFLYSDCS